jgi:acyl carrier protein
MDTHHSGNDDAPNTPLEASIEARILDIIVEHTDTPRDRIAPDTRLFDLTDSLGVTEIIMALEDEFEGSIPDEAASSIQTVGQLTDHVKTHFAARPVEG